MKRENKIKSTVNDLNTKVIPNLHPHISDKVSIYRIIEEI